MSLASLHRLSLLIGSSLQRERECAAFMDWLRSEVGPRRAALFVAAPGRESLIPAAASGFRKPPRGVLPAGHDPWSWLEAQKLSLPRGERYALPILLEGELFGLLAVVSAQKGEALSEEQRLLDLALAYLAPILRNIEHYENVERTVEERFRTLAETTATAIFVYSGEKFIYANRATEELTGYTAAELLAMRFWDVVHPDFREMIRQRGLARQRGEPIPSRYEFKIVRKDGEERWVDFTAGKIEWQGQPAAIGSAFDITERKAAETRLRSVVEQVPLVTYTESSKDRRTIFISPQIQALSGYTPEEWINDPNLWKEIIHPDDRPRVVAEDERTNQSGKPFRVEYRLIARSGEIRWVRDEAVLIRDESGAPLYWQGFMLDITERKQADEALREQEERFRAYIERASDYIFTLDPQGNFTFVNDAMCAALGYREQDLLGKPALTVAAPEARQEAAQTLQRIWDGETVDYMDLPVHTRGGKTLLVQIRGRAFYRNGQLVETLHIARDITLQRQVEEALKESEEKFKTLFHSANDAIFLMNHTTFLDCNATTEKIFQCSRDQIVGRSPVDFSPEYQPDGRLSSESAAEKIEAAFAGKPQFFEWLHTHLDGTPFHAEVSLNRVFVGGEFVLQAIVRDITARKHHERELEAQAMLAQALGESLELQPLLERLLEAARHAIPAAEKGSVLLLEADGRLRVRALNGYGDPRLKEFAFASDSGYSARAARERRPLLIADVRADPEIRYDGEIEEARQIHGAIAAPLLIQERIIGVLSLDSTRKDAFTQEDLNHLVGFAASAALVIENARLFEVERRQRQMAEQLSRALEAGASLTALLDFDLVLDRLLESVEQVIPFDGANIMLLERESGKVRIARLRSYRHLDEKGQQAIQNLSFDLETTENLRWLYENKQPLVIPDTAQYPGWIPVENVYTRSWVGAPILINNQVEAFFSLDHLMPNFFTDEHCLLLQAFAGQASLALQNARLFEETRRRADELAGLYESAEALAGKTSLEEVLQAITQGVVRLFGATGAGLYLYDPLTQTLEVKLATHATIPLGTRLVLGEGLAGKVAQSRRIMRIEDYMRWEGRSPKYDGIPVRAVMEAPLIYQDELLGVLVVHETGESERKFTEADERLLSLFAVQTAAAIQNARLFEETRRRAEEITSLLNASLSLSTLDLQETLHIIGERARSLFRADGCRIFLLEPDNKTLRCVLALAESEVAFADLTIPLGYGVTGHVALTGEAEIVNDMLNDPRAQTVPGTEEEPEAMMFAPLKSGEKTIGVISIRRIGSDRPFQPNDLDLLQAFASLAASAVSNARLFEEIQARLQELEILQTLSTSLRQAHHMEEMLPLFIQYAAQVVNAAAGSIYLWEEASGEWVSRGWMTTDGHWQTDTADLRHRPGEGVTGWVGEHGEIYVTTDWRADPTNQPLPHEVEFIQNLTGGISLPLKAEEHIIGVLHLWYAERREFSAEDKRLLTAIADMAGNAIQRARLHEETTQQVKRLTALRDIDRAIASSFDLNLVFTFLLNGVLTQLNADAADILLFDSHTNMLYQAAKRGFRSARLSNLHLRLDESLAGRAARTRQLVTIPDLKAAGEAFTPSQLPEGENFKAYYAYPLVVKGELKGVLEVFHRAPLFVTSNWLDFFETLAGQAAIAIDNARLFENLERSNFELMMAYDETIEGWSRALDLRDKETEGHTRRVTELTLKLAAQLGIPPADMAHIRRGALLHDIGKMGVPDSILFKDDTLTSREWEIMRQHPVHAYEMLSPIAYLKPALDIPYCHHEKWDGTGYPQGLKGEQIPLAARIFAVVDVYDALTSDRPYRPAWTKEQALEYIREQTGKHFDPQVAAAFLNLIEFEG